jgi:flagellar hook-basal body complex protein FliE
MYSKIINPQLGAGKLQLEKPTLKAGISKSQAPLGFAQSMDMAFQNLKQVDNAANFKMEDYAAGKNLNVDDVLLTLNKANLATNFAVQVRNKLVDGYKELKNTQI